MKIATTEAGEMMEGSIAGLAVPRYVSSSRSPVDCLASLTASRRRGDTVIAIGTVMRTGGATVH